MPDPRTRADALSLFQTGAVSAGAGQADPALSLGGYRASNRAGGRSMLLGPALRGVRIDYAAGANGAGTGSLQATGAGSLGWTPPGGARGAAVAIANGQTKLIEGADPAQFVIVTRTSADDLAGAAAVELLDVCNDVLGQADGEVPAGTTYRCVCLKNGPAQTVTGLKVWLGDCTDDVAIALEQPGSQPDGAFQVIANEAAAPTGVSFVSPTSAAHADVITVAALGPDEQVAIWTRRDLSAAAATPKGRLSLGWSYRVTGGF
jgi:hypothetical protein